MNPLDFLKEFLNSSSTYSFRKSGTKTAQAAEPTSTPKASSQPQQKQQQGASLEDAIRQVMKARGAPMAREEDISLLAQAGRQFQQAGLDPLMPTILSIRETQGGKDLQNTNPKGTETGIRL